MRIVEINIPQDHITTGLKPISMSKLNQCMLIVGKNGSGKTRLLLEISKALDQKPKKSVVTNALSQVDPYQTALQSIQQTIDKLNHQFQSAESIMKEHFAGQISQQETQKTNLENAIKQLQNNINWSLIKTDDLHENYTPISFVPNKLDIKDNSNAGKRDLKNLADNACKIGIEQMSASSFAYIQFLQDKWFNATHPDIKASNDDKNKAISDYKNLQEIIRSFLNCEIERDLDGQATIFSLQLARSNLSNGQKVVLQYCIAIHAQGAMLDDHILILDEPENHLHPSILIELIDKIKTFNHKGQIWIATHSIPLLSYFDPQDIWYMEDGSISKDGKVTEKVLQGLLGDEEHIEKLKDFISLPALQAVKRYAYEALFPPKAIDTGANDPQILQIHSAIASYIQPVGKIKILDYGAGKARMLNGFEGNKEDFLAKIDYYAFERYSENKDDCIYSMGRFYENPDNRYFQIENELKAKHDDNSFDIVIMCNVLHEIDPHEWLNIFGHDGFITKMLKSKGILLLIEDHRLPHGEKAYQNGFIVLDTPEIKKLFCISSEDTNFNYDDFRGDGRLKAHRIPQTYLEKVTSETRKIALRDLTKNAKYQINRLRKEEPKNYKNGQLSGFWIHQLCNAELVLSEL